MQIFLDSKYRRKQVLSIAVGIDLGTTNEMGKNFIVFTFVPINSMIVLPFLASSYKYFKQKGCDDNERTGVNQKKDESI